MKQDCVLSVPKLKLLNSPQPKILIVGAQKKWALEHYFVRHFKTLNTEVEVFPAHDIFVDYYHHSIWRKLYVRSGLSNIYDKIEKELLEYVDRYEPNVVWIFKGMWILPSALKKLRAKGIKLVNYNPDHPFHFSGRGSGNQIVLDSISLYDLHQSYHPEVIKRIEGEYKLPCAVLPFGYEITDQQYEEFGQQEEVVKACFAGTSDPMRAKAMQHLASKGIQLDVFGNDWERYLGEVPNVELHPPAYREEYWATLRKYRVQINLFRPHNNGSHNMRTFEVPALGGIMIAPDSPDHRQYFTPDKEILLYADLDDLAEKIKDVLSWPKAQADEFRQAARDRSVSSGYSYYKRTEEVVRQFSDLLTGKYQLKQEVAH